MPNAALPKQSLLPAERSVSVQSPLSVQSLIVQIEPWVDEAELRELKRVIDSTFLVEHDLTREFESQTASLAGSAIPSATSASSGSRKSLASAVPHAPVVAV